MDATSSTASSSASFLKTSCGLVAPSDRVGFREMLQHELRNRELPDAEMRRVAEDVWRKFNRVSWPIVLVELNCAYN